MIGRGKNRSIGRKESRRRRKDRRQKRGKERRGRVEGNYKTKEIKEREGGKW